MNDKPVALVTGASSGIGRSAALALARAGHDLAVNYASSKDRAEGVAKEAEELGAPAIATSSSRRSAASTPWSTTPGRPSAPRRRTWTGCRWTTGTGCSP